MGNDFGRGLLALLGGGLGGYAQGTQWRKQREDELARQAAEDEYRKQSLARLIAGDEEDAKQRAIENQFKEMDLVRGDRYGTWSSPWSGVGPTEPSQGTVSGLLGTRTFTPGEEPMSEKDRAYIDSMRAQTANMQADNARADEQYRINQTLAGILVPGATPVVSKEQGGGPLRGVTDYQQFSPREIGGVNVGGTVVPSSAISGGPFAAVGKAMPGQSQKGGGVGYWYKMKYKPMNITDFSRNASNPQSGIPAGMTYDQYILALSDEAMRWAEEQVANESGGGQTTTLEPTAEDVADVQDLLVKQGRVQTEEFLRRQGLGDEQIARLFALVAAKPVPDIGGMNSAPWR